MKERGPIADVVSVLLELQARELREAHAHMDRREAELDAHGYGGAPRRWTCSFAYNLFESLLTLGAVRRLPRHTVLAAVGDELAFEFGGVRR